jgi:hypothetical protein
VSYSKNDSCDDGCVTVARRARAQSRRTRRLHGPVPLHFEEFYRAKLRFVVGARLRTTEVLNHYLVWAAENAKPSIEHKQLSRVMRYIGHDSMNSAGMRFLDVGLATMFPDVADNYPAVPLAAEARGADIAARLDSMITELTALRADLVRVAQFTDLGTTRR